MITHTKEVKEYRKDGSLMYECTIAFLSAESEHLYERRILGVNGSFIRVNHATKYREDGSKEWRLVYNNKGEIIGANEGSINNKQLTLLF